MPIQILHFDVFTLEPGKGNPAGIVLSADALDENTMQLIAAAAGYNDTAFVSASRQAEFQIRYFSPRKEVDLCGHATIAASIALHAHGFFAERPIPHGFSIETKAGILPITIEEDTSGEKIVLMSQADARFRNFNGDLTSLCEALGISTTDLNMDFPVVYGSTGRWTLIFPVRDLDAIRRMRPRNAMFMDVMNDMPTGTSIHPFCMETIGKDVDMHARHFSAPGSGTVEDPVTGAASGVLGAYCQEFTKEKRKQSLPLIIEQGYEVGRPGHVFVWAEKQANSYKVRIAGNACFVDSQIFPQTSI